MKPTKFMSNSPQMLQQLCKRCDHSHKHQHLVGGRCADAACYPLPLIRAILNGIEDTTKAVQHARMEELENGMHAAALICANRIQKQATGEAEGVEVLGRTVRRQTVVSRKWCSRKITSRRSTTMSTQASLFRIILSEQA